MRECTVQRGRMGSSGPIAIILVGLISRGLSVSYNSYKRQDQTYIHLRPVVRRLDVLEICRVLESGEVPVQLAQPTEDNR